MAWIVFDKETRNGLSGTPAQLASGDPLAFALSHRRDSVVLLPGASADQVLLLTVKQNRKPAQKAKKSEAPSIRYVSGGFLGLTDEAVVEEAPEEQRSWWKKLVG
jgi:hypothetical protein